ncbi:MAG: MaoC/PaaZ C-terminal domain-containing protein [Rhodocyclaceae bacterium]|nr:MaoC/PaaZ C-terminal domain-containing protein [Rhodocyclaceae bacterium]
MCWAVQVSTDRATGYSCSILKSPTLACKRHFGAGRLPAKEQCHAISEEGFNGRSRRAFQSAMTMTETHIVMGAGLFGDFNRLHVDEPFAGESRYGGRIAHGYLTSSLIAASYGMVFHGTAIAYLDTPAGS